MGAPGEIGDPQRSVREGEQDRVVRRVDRSVGGGCVLAHRDEELDQSDELGTEGPSGADCHGRRPGVRGDSCLHHATINCLHGATKWSGRGTGCCCAREQT